MEKPMMMFVFVPMVIMTACASAKTQSLEQFYTDAKIQEVDKITIQDGSTGFSKTMTESQQVDEFLALIQDIEFAPQANQEKRNGWRYSVTLFDQETKFTFTTNQIGQTYYDTNPDILPIVDDYYQLLEVDEE